MPGSITVQVSWDMGHRLPHHDGHCKNLHGHHYVAEVTVEGEINTVRDAPDEGMVVDFTDVKTALRAQVAKLDHMFLLHRYDEFAVDLKWMPGLVLVDFVPTAENIAKGLLEALPQVSRVRLWETPTSFAEVWR